MLRAILGILAGLVVGVITIMAIETLGHAMFPSPPGLNPNDPAQLAQMMDAIPVGAKLAVLLAWFLGVLVGGIAAMAVSRRRTWTVWVVASVLFSFAVLNMFLIPHPVWMMAGAVAVALAGGGFATRLVR